MSLQQCRSNIHSAVTVLDLRPGSSFICACCLLRVSQHGQRKQQGNLPSCAVTAVVEIDGLGYA